MRTSTNSVPQNPRRHNGERGAVATIVAIFFAGLVIMAMLAISIDLGNLTYERRQAQNAADATSLALASNCAADAANCDPTLPEVAGLLGANAHDNAMQYSPDPNLFNGACARGDDTQVGPLKDTSCPDGDVSKLLQCPTLPTWLKDNEAIPYVETYAATETATADAELFLPFSRVLLGGSVDGDAGTSACARAAWGTPGGFAGALPVTFSRCEWSRQVETGGGYVTEGPIGASATNPGYGGPGQPAWPDANQEVILRLKSGSVTPNPCSGHNPPGVDVPGGFGWLETSPGECEAKLWPADWVHIDTGISDNSCIGDLKHRVIDIPIFDCTAETPLGRPPAAGDDCEAGNGNNTYYHLAGWAKFYVSATLLKPPPNTVTSPSGNGKSCSNPERCVIGWFLTGTLAEAPSIVPPGSGNDFGVHVIKPAG